MKKKLAIILIIFLIGILGVCIYYAINLNENKKEEKEVIELENTPKKDEPYKNETTLNDNFGSEEEGKEIDLKYDQYITASGYAGASNNVYYTRNGVLYHLIISTNQTIKLAEGVEKIESDLDGMMAYKGKNFKLIKEDEYVTYID